MGLGGYFAFFWPRSVRQRIEEGKEDTDMEKTVRWVWPMGAIFFFFCLAELLWKIYRYLK